MKTRGHLLLVVALVSALLFSAGQGQVDLTSLTQDKVDQQALRTLLPGEELRLGFLGEEQGEVVGMQVDGTVNVPLVVTVTSVGGFKTLIEMVPPDVRPNELSSSIGDGISQLAFSPEASGMHEIYVFGDGSEGVAVLKLDYVAGSPQERLVERALPLGGTGSGTLGGGAYDVYTFAGVANTPIGFDLHYDDSLSMSFSVKDAADQALKKKSVAIVKGPSPTVIFTPPTDGDYRLYVYGDFGLGNYDITSRYALGTPEERGVVLDLPLGNGEPRELIAGAFDRYRFEGAANVPLRMSVSADEGLEAEYEVRDSADTVVDSGTFAGETAGPLLFVPATDETYTLSVIGSKGSGTYTLATDYALGTPEERGTRALAPDQPVEATLASNAFDTYAVAVEKGASYTVDVKSLDGLHLTYEVLDDQGNVLLHTPEFIRLPEPVVFTDFAIPFTAESDGEVLLRLTGQEARTLDGFTELGRFTGTYQLRLSPAASP